MSRKKKGRIALIITGIVLILPALAIFVMNSFFPRMTFIGHASIKIKATTGEVIYIDPYYPSKTKYNEPADYILITHGHSDHNRIDLCKQNENCKVIKWSDAYVDGEYRVFEDANIRIEAVPSGGNNSHSFYSNVGYVVTVNGVSVYHGGDTSFAEETKCIADKDIDYGLYTVNGVYTMGPDEASEMADYIRAGTNIPIHGEGKKYKEQFNQFHAKNTRRLHIGQTIYLR